MQPLKALQLENGVTVVIRACSLPACSSKRDKSAPFASKCACCASQQMNSDESLLEVHEGSRRRDEGVISLPFVP